MRFLCVVGAACVAWPVAHAQQAPKPQPEGFTIGAGLAAGNALLTTDYSGGDASDRRTGLSGYLRVGGAVRRSLIIAGEADGYVRYAGDVQTTIWLLSLVTLWYPDSTSGWHVKGGIGVARAETRSHCGVAVVATSLTMGLVRSDIGYDGSFCFQNATGPGVTFGFGYDWRVAQNVSVTWFTNILYMPNAPIEPGVRMGGNVLQMGLGVTLR